MKKTTLISIPVLAATILLSACGGSSNPKEKYKGLDGVPANDEKATTQTVHGLDLFILTVEGTNEVNNGNFIEGQASEMLIKVQTRTKAITKYSVQLTDFTHMNRPVLTETNVPGIYSILWTPPVGTSSKTFQAQIQISALETTNPQLDKAGSIKNVNIVVSQNNLLPTISGKSDLSAGVEEDRDTEFTVDVIDPSSLISPKLPTLDVTRYISSNTEAYRADGSRYIVFDDTREENPKKISETIYRFYFKVQVDRLPLDRDRLGKVIPSANSVDMCFYIQAVSSVDTRSIQDLVCTKARYAAQAPVITFLEPEITDVKAGAATTLSVRISSQHNLSEIVVNKLSQTIEKLSGQKGFSCAYEFADRKNSQVCVLTWTPACTSTTVVTSMTVKADSILNEKTKSSSAVKTLNVVPDLVACPVKIVRKVK